VLILLLRVGSEYEKERQHENGEADEKYNSHAGYPVV